MALRTLTALSRAAPRAWAHSALRPFATSTDTIPKVLSMSVRGLEPSATLNINEKSEALKAQGKKVYKFGLGQSPFPVVDCVIDELKKHAAEKDYLPVKGLAALRAQVAKNYSARIGVNYTQDDILVGPGSKELLFLVQLCYYGELLLPQPSWVSYGPQAEIIGRKLHWLKTTPEDNWVLKPENLKQHCASDSGKPRLLVLNYPSNPTGCTYSPQELKDLANVCREEKILILSDEIYGDCHHAGAHESIAKYYPEGTIISGGLSKWCGAGGWRLGLYAFPKELRWMLDAMGSVASETYTSVSTPIQYAAVKAYELGNKEIDQYVLDSQRVLDAIGKRVVADLRAADVKVQSPQGGFYVFPDFSAHKEKMAAKGITTSKQMTERILDDTGVAFLPGSFFGMPEGEMFARIAFVNFDGATALKEMAKLDANTSEEAYQQFVVDHCSETVEALALIQNWIKAL